MNLHDEFCRPQHMNKVIANKAGEFISAPSRAGRSAQITSSYLRMSRFQVEYLEIIGKAPELKTNLDLSGRTPSS
jgi:hypothetical protein